MNKNKIIIALLIIGAITAIVLWPNTYTVGKSSLLASDFASVQDCIERAGRNDTCKVSGTFAEDIRLNQAGLTIEGGTVQSVTITAPDTTVRNMTIQGSQSFGVYVNANRAIIEDNVITDSKNIGVMFNKTTSGGIVKNNILRRNSQACIELRGSNHISDNNDCSGSIQYPDGVTRTAGMDADCFHTFGSNHLVKNNYCHDITLGKQGGVGQLTGINTDPHIDCFSTWGDSSNGILNNSVFEYNDCYLIGNPMAKSVQAEGGSFNLTFRNNLFQTESGANLSGSSQYANIPVNNIIFDHNTFVSSNKSGAQGIDSKNATNVTVTNNIFAYMPAFWLRGGNVVNNNCLWQVSNSRPADPGQIKANPQFTDEAKRDFRLLAGSPCVGRGAIFADVPNATETPQISITHTLTPIFTFSPTSTLEISRTVSPSATLTPTITPTRTPSPTATPRCFRYHAQRGFFCSFFWPYTPTPQ